MLREMFNCVKIGPGIALKDISQKSGCDSYHMCFLSLKAVMYYDFCDTVTMIQSLYCDRIMIQ